MLLKRLSFLDKMLLVISLVGLLLTGFILFRDDLIIQNLMRRRLGELEIGKIVKTRNDVRRRLNQSLTWYPTSSREAVFERDSLFTGTDSEMEISVDENHILHLNSNSLVVLQSLNNEIIFNLKLGSLILKSLNNTPIKILSGGKISIMKFSKPGTLVSVEKNKYQELTFEIDTGSIEVETEGQILLIQPKNAVSIEPVPIPPNIPPTEKPAPVEKTIAPEVQQDKIDPANIKSNPTPENRPQVQAQPKAKPKTEPIIVLDAPTLLSPADKTTLVTFSPKEIDSTLFVWKAVAKATEYEIQFSTDADFKTILQTLKVPSNQFILKKVLSLQPIFWRARSVLKDSVSDWSKFRTFEVQVPK